MARGWGRSEEDQDADKEAQRERVSAASGHSRNDLERTARRRAIELSLAHVEQELAQTEHPARRAMLETARADLLAQLAASS